jgi:hypothetical protein
MATRAKRDEDRPFSSDKPWGWLLEDIMRRDPDRRHELIVKNWIALTSLTQSEVRPLVDLLRFGLEPMPVVRQHIAHMLDPAADQELRLVVESRRRKPGPRPAEGNLEDDNSEQTKIRYALRQGNVDPLVSAWRNRRAVGPHVCELLAHMLYPSDGTEDIVPYRIMVRGRGKGRRPNPWVQFEKELRAREVQLKVDGGMALGDAIWEVAEAGDESDEVVKRDWKAREHEHHRAEQAADKIFHDVLTRARNRNFRRR